MDRVTSLIAACARGGLLLVTCGVMCGALTSCIGGGSASDRSRCGRSYITPVYWGASAGAAGAWYGGIGAYDGAYYASGWYDPGDDGYDPATDSGGITTDPNSDDGSGWDQPDDGSDDTSGDTGDTGDDTGGDSSGEAVTRLHLYGVRSAPLPPTSSSSSSSSSLPPPRSPSPSPPQSSSSSSPPLPAGCFACTMGCRTDASASASGRQAVGVSDTSTDDACGSAVRTLAQWSHDTSRARLVSCQRIDAPLPPRD